MAMNMEMSMSGVAAALIATSVVGASWMYSTLNSPVVWKKKMNQSVEFSPSTSKDETGIFRNGESPEIALSLEGMKTLDQLVAYARKRYAKLDYIGMRTIDPHTGHRGPYKYRTYESVIDEAYDFASGCLNLGIKPQENIGIYAPSCTEWKITEYACYCSRFVIISLYDTLGPTAAEYILDHGEIKTVFVAKKMLPKLISFAESLKHKAAEDKTRTFYLSDFILLCTREELMKDEAGLEKRAAHLGIKLHFFDEVVKSGKQNPTKLPTPEPNDAASIMYTSGTTGTPKGVILTHHNIMSALGGFDRIDKRREFASSPEDQNSQLSYLPLAHIMQRVSEGNSTYRGVRISYFQGEIKNLFDDFKEVKPSGVVGVPRVYQRIYDRVISTVNSAPWLRRNMFWAAYNYKKRVIAQGGTTPFLDKIIFSKLNDTVFGGKVNSVVSGSAALSKEVHEFLRVCFSYQVLEGYGLTETTAGALFQYPDDPLCGRVGPPHPAVEIKLKSVPDMNYLVTDPTPRGEILVRGPCVTSGYYKEAEKTAEVLKDGWFETGDVGRLNDDGTFSIIDRKKNIFKLSQGEYIAPEFLENILCRSRFVQQNCIYGDSSRNVLVAVIVPDKEYVNSKFPNKSQDLESICKDSEIKKAIFDDIISVCKHERLNGYEIVKAIHLEHELFSVENEMLTHTLKLKRHDAYKKYKPIIEEMYAKLPPH